MDLGRGDAVAASGSSNSKGLHTEQTYMHTLHLLAAAVSIVICILSLVNMTRSLRPGHGRPVRFMDRLIFILFVLDTVESVLMLMSLVSVHYPWACQVQGTLLVFICNCLIQWNALITAYSLVLVKRPTLSAKVEGSLPVLLAFVLGLSAAGAVYVACRGYVGFAFFTHCWISAQHARQALTLFYLPLGVLWLADIAMSIRLVWMLQEQLKGVVGHDAVIRRVRLQALMYASVFIFFYGVPLSARLYTYVTNSKPPTVFMVPYVINSGLLGVYDSLVYGRLNRPPERKRGRSVQSSRYGPSSFKESSRSASSTAPVANDGTQVDTERLRSYGVFVTTYNCGAGLVDINDLSSWLPKPGVYHTYVIGLQECMVLRELKRAISAYLGGPHTYTLFSESLGSTNSSMGFNGEIAILVWIRCEDVDDGRVQEITSARKEVATGTNLIAMRAPNKGAVGLAFRYGYDTTVAFISCHLASDKGAHSMSEARDGDVADALGGVVMGLHATGFDVHVQHHHVVVLGDLNYRIRGLSAAEVIRMIYESGRERIHGWRSYAYRKVLENRQFLPDEEEPEHFCRQMLAHDELQIRLSSRSLLHGFRERVIGFPPTYRLQKGRAVDCHEDLMELGRAYKIFTSEPERLRVPAYTDRILVHSMDERQDQVLMGAYESCDALACSDHRPVSLQLRLLVHDRPTPTHTRPHTPAHAHTRMCTRPPVCRCQHHRNGSPVQRGCEGVCVRGDVACDCGGKREAGDVKDDGGGLCVWCVRNNCNGCGRSARSDEQRHGHGVSCASHTRGGSPESGSCGGKDESNGALAEGGCGVEGCRGGDNEGVCGSGGVERGCGGGGDDDDVGDGGGGGGIAVRVRLQSLQWTPLEGKEYTDMIPGTQGSVATVTVMLPLPIEDDRGVARALSFLSGSLDRTGNGTDHSFEPDQHTFEWKSGGTITLKATVYPLRGLHAAFKLQGNSCEPMGQGILGLEDLYSTLPPPTPLGGGSSQRKRPFRAAMCRHGRLIGHLGGVVCIKAQHSPSAIISLASRLRLLPLRLLWPYHVGDDGGSDKYTYTRPHRHHHHHHHHARHHQQKPTSYDTPGDDESDLASLPKTASLSRVTTGIGSYEC